MENVKTVEDFYNKTATGFSEEFLKDRKESEILKKFYKCFSLGGTSKPRILDVGCGAGYDSKVLCSLGAKVMGIDISENLIQIAKIHVPNCRFVVGDITESMTALGSFDGISCLATLVHVDVQKMKTTFDNFAEILRPSGLLLVSSLEGAEKNIEKSLVQIDGEQYDKDYNSYSVWQLCNFAHPKFKLVDTWKFGDFNEGWRYYVFMKQ